MKLFHNAQIVKDDTVIHGHLIVDNGKITEILSGIPSNETQTKASETIDCENNYLLPGFIDSHVHFRDLEQKEKETLESGSRAALCGGVTSVLTMPNTKPPISTAENLSKYHDAAKNESLYCNVGFIGGVKENFDWTEFKAMSKNGIFGIKVYPGDKSTKCPLLWLDGWKTDLVPSEFEESFEVLCRNFKNEYPIWRKLFELANTYNIPVIFHPELPTTDETFKTRWENGKAIAKVERMKNPKIFAHDVTHPIYSNELSFIEMITAIVRNFFPDPSKAPHLHFVHISSPEVAEIIEIMLKKPGYSCSYEITPHHMLLNYKSEFQTEADAKVLVPLRAPRYQEEMLKLALTGKNDVFGTDHAPHTFEEKHKAFLDIPSGFPSIDFAASILMSLVYQNSLSIQHLVHAFASNPAKIYGISKKGKIEKDFDADFVLFKKTDVYPVNPESMKGKQKWTPWENFPLIATVDRVWLKGKLAYNKNTEEIHPFGQILLK